MPHNNDLYEWMGKKHLWFFSNRRDRETSPEREGSGANHYPRALALLINSKMHTQQNCNAACHCTVHSQHALSLATAIKSETRC